MPHPSLPVGSRLVRRHALLLLLAVAVIVGGANAAAYATTGHPLLVGRANSTGALTTWARTSDGPVVGFRPQPGSPPFTTTSSARVLRLDADQVDGHDAADLQTSAVHYRVPSVRAAVTTLFSLPGLPRARYLATYSVLARTPDGDVTCGWTTGAPGNGLEGLAFGVRRFHSVSINGSAVIDARRVTPQLWCSDHSGPGGHGFEISDAAPARSSISLVRLDDVRETTTSSSRPHEHR